MLTAIAAGVKECVRKVLIEAMGFRNQSKHGLVMAISPG
jgi:hypothetical protein